MRRSSIITGVSYVAVCGIIGYVAPKFEVIFSDLGVTTLPVLTRNIINMGSIVWFLIGIIFAVLIIGKDLISSPSKVPNRPFVIILIGIVLTTLIALFPPMDVIMGGIN